MRTSFYNTQELPSESVALTNSKSPARSGSISSCRSSACYRAEPTAIVRSRMTALGLSEGRSSLPLSSSSCERRYAACCCASSIAISFCPIEDAAALRPVSILAFTLELCFFEGLSQIGLGFTSASAPLLQAGRGRSEAFLPSAFAFWASLFLS